MSKAEARSRAKLGQIWQSLDSSGKTEFSRKLFTGSPSSRKRSVRRLISGSRRITKKKQSTINRSFGGKDLGEIYDAEPFEKADVTEYFKPYVEYGQRAWNGRSPPYAFLKPYRIWAVVSVAQKGPDGEWRTIQLEMYPKGVGRSMRELAGLLQDYIDNIFTRYYDTDNPSDTEFETFGIAFSEEGEDEMVGKLNKKIKRDNISEGESKPLAYPIRGDFFVMIFASSGMGKDYGQVRD